MGEARSGKVGARILDSVDTIIVLLALREDGKVSMAVIDDVSCGGTRGQVGGGGEVCSVYWKAP